MKTEKLTVEDIKRQIWELLKDPDATLADVAVLIKKAGATPEQAISFGHGFDLIQDIGESVDFYALGREFRSAVDGGTTQDI